MCIERRRGRIITRPSLPRNEKKSRVKRRGLHDLTSLESALKEAMQKVRAERIKPDDKKARAKILRAILDQGTLRVRTGGLS
jgi:hypothetical protein